MTKNKVTIPAKLLYTLARDIMDIQEDEDYQFIIDPLVEYGVIKRHYPTPEEIHQQSGGECYSFWDDMEEGDSYYELGTQEEMIARLEGKT